MSDSVNEPPLERAESDQFRTAPSLVVVNTGDGKGKSTAAFGMVLRAAAQDWTVGVVQFLKSGDWRTGEEKICRQLGVDWFAAGDGFTWDSDDIDESRSKAEAAWRFAVELIERGDHRLLVLDEISYAMSWGWIETDEVVAVVKNRPERTNVVLTGRDMPQAIFDVADTVTEMRKIKHAFDSGIVAKKGIDF